MARRKRHHAALKRQRKRAREARARRRSMRREQRERDVVVTEMWGYRAHMECGRKLYYATKELAMARALKSVACGAPMLRAYKCPYCEGWHLTSKPEPADDMGEAVA